MEYMDGGLGDDPTQTVYGFVPLKVINQMIHKHGGISQDYCNDLDTVNRELDTVNRVNDVSGHSRFVLLQAVARKYYKEK